MHPAFECQHFQNVFEIRFIGSCLELLFGTHFGCRLFLQHCRCCLKGTVRYEEALLFNCIKNLKNIENLNASTDLSVRTPTKFNDSPYNRN